MKINNHCSVILFIGWFLMNGVMISLLCSGCGQSGYSSSTSSSGGTTTMETQSAMALVVEGTEAVFFDEEANEFTTANATASPSASASDMSTSAATQKLSLQSLAASNSLSPTHKDGWWCIDQSNLPAKGERAGEKRLQIKLCYQNQDDKGRIIKTPTWTGDDTLSILTYGKWCIETLDQNKLMNTRCGIYGENNIATPFRVILSPDKITFDGKMAYTTTDASRDLIVTMNFIDLFTPFGTGKQYPTGKLDWSVHETLGGGKVSGLFTYRGGVIAGASSNNSMLIYPSYA